MSVTTERSGRKGSGQAERAARFDRTVSTDIAIITWDVFDHARLYCFGPRFGHTLMQRRGDVQIYRTGVSKMELEFLFEICFIAFSLFVLRS